MGSQEAIPPFLPYTKAPSLQFDPEPETHHGFKDKLSNSLEWRLEENNVFRPDFGDSSFTEVEDPSGSRIVVVTPGTLDNLPPRLGPPPVSISPGPSQLPVVVKPQ